MYSVYRGIIDPNSRNQGGRSLMITEKYNHRCFLNLIKPKPLIHNQYMDLNYPIANCQIPIESHDQNIGKLQRKSSTFHGMEPRFFRNVESNEKLSMGLLNMHPMNLSKSKKYREKTTTQMLMSWSKQTDPYGYKESKYRLKLNKEGKSYASGLTSFNHREQCAIDEFDGLQLSNTSIIGLKQIVIQICLLYNLKDVASISKLMNHIQRQHPVLTIQDFDNIYYQILQQQAN